MKRIAVSMVALGGIVGSGAAIAATTGSPSEEADAVIDSAAEKLGVTSDELSDALRDALKERVDAAVAGGRLDEDRAAELKERIDSGDVPLLGLGHPHGPPVGLDAAAYYLGLTDEQLRAELSDGNTLAEIAEAQGKSVDSLVDALVEAGGDEERVRELVDRELMLRRHHR